MPGASVEYVLGRIPYVQIGNGSDPLFVITGGQGFVRRFDRDDFARDARRAARILPRGMSFLLLGYDPDPALTPSADMIADQFATALLHFGDRPVDLIGISYGGLVAVRLAARHPKRVRTLTLIASAHHFSSEGRRRVRHQISCAEREDWPALISGFTAVFRRPWLNALLRLRLWMSRNTLRRQMSTRSTILCYLTAMMEAQPVALDAVKTPTLIVGGSEDQFFGEAMQEAAAGIGKAELHLLAGETHMVPIERAADVAAIVTAFLNSAGSPPAKCGFTVHRRNFSGLRGNCRLLLHTLRTGRF